MYASSPAALWLIVFAATAALALLPYALKGPPVRAAAVEPANCNGCGRCAADCPYEAIVLAPHPRAAGAMLASVHPGRCAACGICAGACPSSTPFRSARELVSGIDLPDLTVHDLRQKLRAALRRAPQEIVFCCEGNCTEHPEGIALRCLAMLPPSFIEYALRHGARTVRAVGCKDECAYRLGIELTAERVNGQRAPHLRTTVKATPKNHEYSFALR